MAAPRTGLRGALSRTARPLPDDDPRARLRRMRRPLLGRVVRWFGDDLLTVRIDLKPPNKEALP